MIRRALAATALVTLVASSAEAGAAEPRAGGVLFAVALLVLAAKLGGLVILHPLSAVFVPLFFVLMGFQVDLASLASGTVLLVGGALVAVAIVGKLACALGVVGTGVNRLAVAIGMVSRGEVGLVFAGVGATLVLGDRPLLDQGLFSALVLMVLVTTVVTPPSLRWAFRRRSG
ncbi:MAG: cation:proton antiporter [Candidatus Rokubacteria bacterium]|nr:cation:proton antiporter [Candidatus Rokubacteria bacterium]